MGIEFVQTCLKNVTEKYLKSPIRLVYNIIILIMYYKINVFNSLNNKNIINIYNDRYMFLIICILYNLQ